MTDPDALASEHLGYALAVGRACARRLGWTWYQDEAESVALVALAEAVRKFDPTRGMRARGYVRDVVRWRVSTWLRDNARRDGVPIDAGDGDDAPDRDPVLARHDRSGERREAFDHLVSVPLHPFDREILGLIYVEGHSVEGAARVLGIKRSTAHLNHHQALDRVRRRALAS